MAEQRRVVARIEELCAQIHEARKLRKEAAEEAEAMTGSLAFKLYTTAPYHASIDTIADVRGGIQKGPHRAPVNNPVRYLTVAHVHRNKIVSDDPRYFEVTPVEIENCVHQNHVIRIRPFADRIASDFLNLFLNSPPGQAAVQELSRTSSGLRSLSVGRIKSIRIPLPPLPEQRRIVAELDALQAEVDALKRLQTETSAELDALLPSILDRAFSGML